MDRNVTWRIMYHLALDAVVILDVFTKKSATTPDAVIAACRQRLAAFQRVSRTRKKDEGHAQR